MSNNDLTKTNPEDSERVFKSDDDLQAQAESGDIRAQELCGLLHDLNLIDSDGSGFCKREDKSKAKEMYKSAADQGSSTAQLAYAKLLMDDKDPDFTAAESYFKMAEDNGYIRFQRAAKKVKYVQSKIDQIAGKKVLVVDDNQTEREMLCGLINKRGFEAVPAKHGGDALSVLRNDRGISLILLDVNMPIMNGIEFLKKVRAMEFYKNVAVIVSSSSTDKEHIIEAKKLGVGGWLVKPVEIKKLDKILDYFKAAT
ncbi:response regulator [bacterium]|nr:response regulator [bacterium]